MEFCWGAKEAQRRMKKGKKRTNDSFGVVVGMEKDGIQNVQRRKNAEERGEKVCG